MSLLVVITPHFLCPLCLYLSFASWRFYPRLCPFLLSVVLEVVASRNTALRRRCCQLRYGLPFPLPPPACCVSLGSR